MPNVPLPPRAMPWAGLLRPLRGEFSTHVSGSKHGRLATRGLSCSHGGSLGLTRPTMFCASTRDDQGSKSGWNLPAAVESSSNNARSATVDGAGRCRAKRRGCRGGSGKHGGRGRGNAGIHGRRSRPRSGGVGELRGDRGAARRRDRQADRPRRAVSCGLMTTISVAVSVIIFPVAVGEPKSTASR